MISVEKRANVCVIRELPTSHSLPMIYMNTHLRTRKHLQTQEHEKVCISFVGEVMLAVFCSECVFVCRCGPHRADSPSEGDGTVASGEMDGRSEQRGVKGRREGKDGE